MARAHPSWHMNDIIAARATAAGPAAIALVRASGPGVIALAARLFTPVSPAREVANLPAGQLTLGVAHTTDCPEVPLDRCLLAVWRAPHSHTGEDMAEFHLHGSPVVAGQVLEALARGGARLAAPGEFTRRAFLNGKLDLAQAEAVCDLIRARTESAGRAALSQLGGGLSRRLEELRAVMVATLAELEAAVDFPEESLDLQSRETLLARLGDCAREVTGLVQSARRGARLRDGARVVLAGKPNAGKSSLFNLLVRHERALVTPHPGTTRDTVEALVDFEGVPLTLVDTAGLREGAGEIESLGIARTREELKAADLVLFVADAREPWSESGAAFDELRGCPHLVLANKTDLLAGGPALPGIEPAGLPPPIAVSAVTREGLDALEGSLRDYFGGPESGGQETLVTNRRHVAALEEANHALTTAESAIRAGASPEFPAADLSSAISALDSITGRQGLDEDVLDAVFSAFCLGK